MSQLWKDIQQLSTDTAVYYLNGCWEWWRPHSSMAHELICCITNDVPQVNSCRLVWIADFVWIFLRKPVPSAERTAPTECQCVVRAGLLNWLQVQLYKTRAEKKAFVKNLLKFTALLTLRGIISVDVCVEIVQDEIAYGDDERLRFLLDCLSVR